jgi:hypothetical protein
MKGSPTSFLAGFSPSATGSSSITTLLASGLAFLEEVSRPLDCTERLGVLPLTNMVLFYLGDKLNANNHEAEDPPIAKAVLVYCRNTANVA